MGQPITFQLSGKTFEYTPRPAVCPMSGKAVHHEWHSVNLPDTMAMCPECHTPAHITITGKFRKHGG